MGLLYRSGALSVELRLVLGDLLLDVFNNRLGVGLLCDELRPLGVVVRHQRAVRVEKGCYLCELLLDADEVCLRGGERVLERVYVRLERLFLLGGELGRCLFRFVCEVGVYRIKRGKAILDAGVAYCERRECYAEDGCRYLDGEGGVAVARGEEAVEVARKHQYVSNGERYYVEGY